METDFDTIYQKLQPALQNLETHRILLKQKGTRTGLITGGIFFALGCLLTVYAQGGTIGLAISSVIAGGILLFCIDKKSGELSSFYKEHIISVMVKELCEEASFTPQRGISENTFRASGLFSTSPDRYRSEDMISGRVGKTVFTCSEIVAEEKRVTVDGKGNRHERWIDIFRGFFFIADFQKDFTGRTIVYRNSWLKLQSNLQRVKLENPDFEKSFDTYSTDQVEARYILTPATMEKILELDRKFPGKITVSFFHSQVIIAIPDSRDHFETSIWRSQLTDDNIKKEFGTLCTLFGIINDLNLNLRIWTKE